jgi:hypothetical protein
MLMVENQILLAGVKLLVASCGRLKLRHSVEQVECSGAFTFALRPVSRIVLSCRSAVGDGRDFPGGDE